MLYCAVLSAFVGCYSENILCLKAGCFGGHSSVRGTEQNWRVEKRRLESFIICILPKMSENIIGECGMHMEDDMFLKHVILKIECGGIILK